MLTKMTHGREFYLQHHLKFAQQQIGKKVLVWEIIIWPWYDYPDKYKVDW